VPEIVVEVKATRARPDGWAREYLVRRDDGEDVLVRVECSGTAVAVAHHSPELNRVVADYGRSIAMEQAELAEPGRGARATVLCRAFGIFADIRYDRPLAA
jgi:hypothetical protein